MKLETAGNAWFQRHKTNFATRPPLISFKEFADSLNITSGSLRGYITNSVESFPKPVLRHARTRSSSSKSWYNKKEVKDWWANYVSKQKKN